jgi:hypothetical protein
MGAPGITAQTRTPEKRIEKTNPKKNTEKANLYMERAYPSILDQHLVTALSACLTLYIGARSARARHFSHSSRRAHSTRTVALTLSSRGRKV